VHKRKARDRSEDCAAPPDGLQIGQPNIVRHRPPEIAVQWLQW